MSIPSTVLNKFSSAEIPTRINLLGAGLEDTIGYSQLHGAAVYGIKLFPLCDVELRGLPDGVVDRLGAYFGPAAELLSSIETSHSVGDSNNVKYLFTKGTELPDITDLAGQISGSLIDNPHNREILRRISQQVLESQAKAVEAMVKNGDLRSETERINALAERAFNKAAASLGISSYGDQLWWQLWGLRIKGTFWFALAIVSGSIILMGIDVHAAFNILLLKLVAFSGLDVSSFPASVHDLTGIPVGLKVVLLGLFPMYCLRRAYKAAREALALAVSRASYRGLLDSASLNEGEAQRALVWGLSSNLSITWIRAAGGSDISKVLGKIVENLAKKE